MLDEVNHSAGRGEIPLLGDYLGELNIAFEETDGA